VGAAVSYCSQAGGCSWRCCGTSSNASGLGRAARISAGWGGSIQAMVYHRTPLPRDARCRPLPTSTGFALASLSIYPLESSVPSAPGTGLPANPNGASSGGAFDFWEHSAFGFWKHSEKGPRWPPTQLARDRSAQVTACRTQALRRLAAAASESPPTTVTLTSG
jgi:hypothetical protein